MKLQNLQTEYLTTPLALDCEKPRFHWEIVSDRQNVMQESYRIIVKTGDEVVWDSGSTASDSLRVTYDGEALKACTKYCWSVEVTAGGETAAAESWFMTGLLTQDAWEKAVWIGPDEPSLYADTKTLFRIETRFRIPEGSSCAGIVFGADDPRLAVSWRNVSLLEGHSEIRYMIDVSAAMLHIWRVGYAPEDSAEKPFVSVPLGGITPENAHDWHTLAVEVQGCIAMAWLDGELADYELKDTPSFEGGKFALVKKPGGRVLNPLGRTDCIAFPALCRVGYSAEPGSEGVFQSLTVRNVREPKAVIFEITDEQHISGETVTFDPTGSGSPLLRSSITLSEQPVSAILYAAARGIYIPQCNGQRLDDGWFHPGAAQYDSHLFYQAFDMTEKLHTGENTLTVQLASGWWSDMQTFSNMNENFWGDRPSFRGVLVLRYADGREERRYTDPADWQWNPDGPVRYAGFFNGEVYDARLENPRDSWRQAVKVDLIRYPESPEPVWYKPKQQEPEMIAQPDMPVHIVDTLTAKSMAEPKPGVYIYDLGQNIAGVPELHLNEPAGTKVLVRFAEILCPDLPEFTGRVGTLMTENLRQAFCQDICICAGGEMIFRPELTFHGFRYIEVSGVSAPLPLEAVRGVALSSAGLTGSFRCSDELVNQLYSNICWSNRDNFISIPTDCPQRNERMGWAGDAQVFASTAAYNMQAYPFLRKYLVAMRDCQTENGCYPNIAPVATGFGGIAWQSAGVIIPYVLWQQYGDTQIIRENYSAMCRYIEYLKSTGWPGVLTNVGPLGDWLAADMSTDNVLLWNAIFAYDVGILAEMSEAIGEPSAALWQLYKEVKALWNETFIDPETGKTRAYDGKLNDTQCSYALPLAYGVVSEENLTKARQHLAARVESDGCRLNTGFLGTGLINPALTEAGRSDLAYGLLTQRSYPSWLYSVTQGATTIWERWNSYTVENGFGGNNNMNSFNHYSLGAVGRWLYESVLGIRIRGSRLHLAPQFECLDFAEGSCDSICGRVSSAWKREDGKLRWTVTIPANMTVTVDVPGLPETLGSGNWSFVIE